MSNKKSKVAIKIRTKLFFMIVAILVICITVISLANSSALHSALTTATTSTLTNVSAEITSLPENSMTYYFDLYSISVNNNVTLEIVDSDGNVTYNSKYGVSAFYSSQFMITSEVESMTLVETVKAFGADTTVDKKYNETTHTDFLVYSSYLNTGDILHVYTSVSQIEKNVEIATNVFNVICILICILMSLLVYTFVARFSKPLEDMNDVTKDMASLNFDRKCKTYGRDEIGELADSINLLSDTLDTTLENLKSTNARLEEDNEHIRALDNARKSFISNVSHELKTPIAVISGYAEGLKLGISTDEATTQEYYEIISNEAARMNRLVIELLELSKLESGTMKLSQEKYDIGEQINGFINRFSLLFNENGITVENNVPVDLVCVADSARIENVINNYIMNAVSHCSGEKIIRISAENVDDNIRITVFNTGEHIADEDVSELWSSFYRADKSHARSGNRFGLGLSIVKAVMELHKKKCGCNNAENGVEFWFEVTNPQSNN